jgi:acyl-CoA synthetase (AMP-forming)/AMP-acid ligase II
VDGRLDVGRPIANTQVMVMDPAGRELPVGVRGELCIAGAGVALGYHDRPELTRDRFREHPRHGRYYRTGDEARWRPDGTVELLGRADRQVKLRGNRVELGEVEAALLRHPAVRSAAVVVAGAPSPDAALVAFVVTAGGADLPTEDLWEHMRRELPRAFVPQEFVPLEALPVNASQKVDHRELVRLADERRPGPARGGGPSGGHEDELVARLIELWGSVLERDDVDATTHFFANGGHSLLGALLVQRVEERLGVVVSLAELFSEPTPERLARRIRR